MTRWVHPDRLDRLSNSEASTGTQPAASPDELMHALHRALITGGLRRVPRKPRHREIVLALICLRVRRRHPYTEPELDSLLKDVLQALNADVDHATCRRFLVDLGFVKRDRAGTRYYLNPARLETTLSADAICTAEAFLDDPAQSSRL